jgi:hypothetical protein
MRGKCLQAQTEGGITVHVDWSVTYKLEPQQIAAHLRSTMARALPQHSDNMVRSHGNNCMARVISELPVSTLADKGSRGHLERTVREELVKRVRPFGIQVFRVMVTGMELPPKVQATFEAAHERMVHAYSEAESMERLRQVISKFSDSDMERLLLLKQLHEMGQNGVALYMSPFMSTFQSGGQIINGETRDGRKPNGPSLSTSTGSDESHGEWPSVAH